MIEWMIAMLMAILSLLGGTAETIPEEPVSQPVPYSSVADTAPDPAQTEGEWVVTPILDCWDENRPGCEQGKETP